MLLTALSAWLIVQAGYRSRRGAFMAAGAVALALANATAYSGIIIDPIVIIFAFLVWLPCMRWRQASLWRDLVRRNIGAFLYSADDSLGFLDWAYVDCH